MILMPALLLGGGSMVAMFGMSCVVDMRVARDNIVNCAGNCKSMIFQIFCFNRLFPQNVLANGVSNALNLP